MKHLYWFLIILFIQCQSKTALQNPDKIHAFRLKPGEDLRKSISKFIDDHDIKAGWIITAVGSLTQANLRFANQPEGKVINGHFEIVSLVGTLSRNGSHLHLSISDSTGATIGGHLLDDNIVYTTVEIVIGETKSFEFKREKDGTTEWPELQIQEN